MADWGHDLRLLIGSSGPLGGPDRGAGCTGLLVHRRSVAGDPFPGVAGLGALGGGRAVLRQVRRLSSSATSWLSTAGSRRGTSAPVTPSCTMSV